MNQHPNATATLGSSGAAVLVVYIAGLLGLEVPAEVAAAFTGLVAAAFLFVGRSGVKGIGRILWRGSGQG